MSSPTTVYGIIGAVGTGVAALGASLGTIAMTAGAPSSLAITAAIIGAVGGAVSLTAKILGGIATPDKMDGQK
jgi:hypothetical protein